MPAIYGLIWPQFIKLAQVREWGLALDEVRFLEPKAQKKGPAQVPALAKEAWFRDLTMDEDVEENPGPSDLCRSGVSLNVNGAERGWLAAQHYMQQKVDFLCLQEFNITPEKANAFVRMAHRRKYHAHFE